VIAFVMPCMIDVDELVRIVFSGLSPLVIEGVAEQGELILIRARTPAGDWWRARAARAPSQRVHGYHERVVADVPVDARRVVLRVSGGVALSARPVAAGRTFREQVPGVLERYQAARDAAGWPVQIGAVVKELAGRCPAARLFVGVDGADLSAHRLCGSCSGLPPPPAAGAAGAGGWTNLRACAAAGSYATVLIDAETPRTCRCAAPTGEADTLEAWLRRAFPACRSSAGDSSATYCRSDPPSAARRDPGR